MSKKHFELLARNIRYIEDPVARRCAAVAVASAWCVVVQRRARQPSPGPQGHSTTSRGATEGPIEPLFSILAFGGLKIWQFGVQRGLSAAVGSTEGRVVQLDRTLVYGTRGWRFEPSRGQALL